MLILTKLQAELDRHNAESTLDIEEEPFFRGIHYGYLEGLKEAVKTVSEQAESPHCEFLEAFNLKERFNMIREKCFSQLSYGEFFVLMIDWGLKEVESRESHRR